MVIRDYRDLDLLAEDVHRDEHGIRGLSVRVLESPAGRAGPVVQEVPEPVARQLTDLLAGVDKRALDADGVLGLGEALADLLLPDPVRDLLVRSLDAVGAETGLRLRLRLDPALAPIPWELAHVERQGGQRDATGFLALDPRISIVRDADVTGVLQPPGPARERRVVVALASPKAPGYAELKLDTERANIEAALREVPGIGAEFVDRATVGSLTRALAAGPTDVLHFAGHGTGDALVLEGEQAADPPDRLSGDQLAVNLLSRGAQLAVLGACESGLRTAADAWSGVATRLTGAGVPATVAMQYRIGDGNAIEFGRAFYRALASGVPIDGAVAAGRLAVFNRMHPNRDDVRLAGFWRDWGVPVLYLRKGAAVSLVSIVDEQEREKARAAATIQVNDRISTLGPEGVYRGLVAGVMRSGRVDARLRADVLEGSSTLVELDELRGGVVEAETNAGTITGSHTTVRIKEIG